MIRRLLLLGTVLVSLALPGALPVHTARPSPGSAQTKECVVYVTRTGKRYHKAWCSSLRYSKFKTTKAEAERLGYTPCRRCGGSDCE